MKKLAGERRVTLGFWRTELESRYPNKRSNGNYYATYVLLYNDNTYENVSVNLGWYFRFEIRAHCEELYGKYDYLHETRNYESILGRYTCVGLNRENALKKISENSKEWRKIVKNYNEINFNGTLKAVVKLQDRW